MVDVITLTEYIFSLVKQAGIKTFKLRSPNDQKGTFVVVNPLALVGRLDQEAVVNVNVYADNLKLNVDGENDYSQPDLKELNRAIGLVLPLIEDNKWENNVLVNVQQSTPLYEETQTFINIRINYRKINYGSSR